MNTQIDAAVRDRQGALQLTSRITRQIEELARATDAARVSEQMIKYLEFCARFHQYSPFNIWLILLARPDATFVAGYNRWRSLGRYVRRGEKGIPIIAPILFKDPFDEYSPQQLRGFRVVYVFDILQTEGQPLPEPPNWKSPEKNLKLQEKLVHFAQEQGIEVRFRDLGGRTQGISRGGLIEIDPQAGTKTLIHEIAHELLHHDENRPAEASIRELEAEAVAYVVGRYFGLERLASPNYIALHGATSEEITEHLVRIQALSEKIIGTVA